ncbi:MAG: WbqC family protein [Rhodothermaceae bacterium]
MDNEIIAIHQPNFLPWLGYFYKIQKADLFVILDNVQYTKNSICNRNKIKNQQGEAAWLTVPVLTSKGLEQNFNAIEIDYKQKWQKKIVRTLEQTYKKTPYFDLYFDELREILEKSHSSLAELNIELIRYINSKLEIDTPIHIASEIDKEFGAKTDLVIGICKHFGMKNYVSGQGAKKYNEPEKFEKEEINLIYQEFEHPEYPQLKDPFISHLSIIDLLFNCGNDSKNYLIK